MIKRILFFLFMVFIFSGCVERGHMVTPTSVKQTIIESNSADSKKIKNVQKATDNVVAIESETQKSSIEDSTKNTISGILVLIIGIMVFL